MVLQFVSSSTRVFPHFIKLFFPLSASHIMPHPFISSLILLSFGLTPLAFAVGHVDGGHVMGGGDEVEGADA